MTVPLNRPSTTALRSRSTHEWVIGRLRGSVAGRSGATALTLPTVRGRMSAVGDGPWRAGHRASGVEVELAMSTAGK